MKNILYSIFLNLTFCILLLSQTVEDLQKFKTLLKNQQTAKQEIEGQISETSNIPSLETFQDKIDSVSINQNLQKEEISKPDQSTETEMKDDFWQLPYFGHSIFKSARIDFTPEVYGPVDDLYPVGPGDEIVISVWGDVELRHDIIVDRQGQIFIPGVGLTSVLGLNMAQLHQKLTGLMSKSYSSLLNNKAFMDISLGKIRSIRIYLIGDVKNPGLFTLPALTPVFNLFFYAGGFNSTASLRKISLIRKDQLIAKIDFYEFLINGKEFSEIRLQNDDVILVSNAKKQVYIAGAVQKPAIFELLDNEGLHELINYAGDLADNAYTDQIQIERFLDNKERILIDVNYRQMEEQGQNFKLESGDRVLVRGMDRDMKNYINISGPIYGPTRFEYISGMHLKDLFAKVDSMAGDAYLQRIHITRFLLDRKKQLFSINLEAILKNEAPDFLLQPEDHIEIKSKTILFPTDSVRIYGAVNNPGKYLLKLSMNLKDLIFAAGGFRKDALIREAEISRIDLDPGCFDSMATILLVKIDSDYVKHTVTSDENFQLQANDNVFIRVNSDWELQRNVAIQGEVHFPGIYSLKQKTERITDLIDRSGGLKPTAYLEGATLYRKKNQIGQIGIDFIKILKNRESDENIYLQAEDLIYIPERLYTVKVMGGVNFPSSVYFEKGEDLDYYIDAAGGYEALADENNVSIQLANGKTFKPKHFLFWDYLPEDITAGSRVIVPTLAEKRGLDWSGAIRDAAAILSSVATTILIIDRIAR